MSDHKLPDRPEKKSYDIPVDPIKIFDNLFYIGTVGIGLYAIKTSLGLIFIDSTSSKNSYDEIVEPSLKKLGLENEKILAVYLTHGHFDHYMGAKQIRERTGCPVYLNTVDTAFMNFSIENKHDDCDKYIPQIEDVIDDNRYITYGDTTIYAMQAPGHTPGCMNYFVDVYDNGEKHRALIFGGFAIFGPGSYLTEWTHGRQKAVDNALIFARSCMETWEYVKKTQCDVYLNPHPPVCGLMEAYEKSLTRQPGDPSPFVIGVDGVRTWLLDRFEDCTKRALEYSGMRNEYDPDDPFDR